MTKAALAARIVLLRATALFKLRFLCGYRKGRVMVHRQPA
jgi:hypothetical protein